MRGGMAGRPQVVVYGAGGHGKVVAEIILSSGACELLGFLDDGRAAGVRVLGLPVLGGFDWLESHPEVRVVPAVGDNRTRERTAERCLALGRTLEPAIHPTASVSPSARVGAGTVVMANASINAEAHIGVGAIINTGAVIEHDCQVGDFAHVSPNAAMGGGSALGRGSHLGLCACILPLIQVGARSTVGAGAVVREALPDGVTAAGVPARVLRRTSEKT